MTSRILAALVLSGLASGTCLAQGWGQDLLISDTAQGYAYNFGPDYRHASTLAEGVLSGEGRLQRSLGLRRLYEAEARIREEEAKSMYLDNAVKYVETYFERKRINESYRASKHRPLPTTEDLIRISRLRAKRLTPEQLDASLGQINWPAVLDRPEFDRYRESIDMLFAERTPSNSGLGTDNCRSVQAIAKALLDDLGNQIGQMSGEEYMAAKAFVESVAYESQFKLETGTPDAGS